MWSLELQDLKITYRPGKNHLNAYALSRPVINYIISNYRNDAEPYET